MLWVVLFRCVSYDSHLVMVVCYSWCEMKAIPNPVKMSFYSLKGVFNSAALQCIFNSRRTNPHSGGFIEILMDCWFE